MSMEATGIVDVAIVGGGPVGACVGALLARELTAHGAPVSAVVLEQSRPALPEPGAPLDTRVSAFSRASERVLTCIGVWERIRARGVSPYERMHVWPESVAPTAPGSLTFDAADVGEPNLGYIIENQTVQAALLDLFESAGGHIVPGQLTGLHVHEDRVDLETTTGPLAARLVVGADGARSAVRDAIGITFDQASYGQMAIVATMKTARHHESTAWQRFMSTGTLAFLPLADGSSSIVWSTSEEIATRLLSYEPEVFERELTEASDRVLGTVTLASERLSFPLRKLSAHCYVTPRCALVGDAAHVVHPLAGQGVNLGLLDAAALVETLMKARSEREDPGALRILRRYERWRKSENELMSLAIDAFNRFLARGTGPISRVAQRGLGWVNRSAELKRLFIGRALGVSGELPQAARIVTS